MSHSAILRLPAPAKLNLFLHINGRLPNGYHELQTVFQLIDFCDWLTFSSNATGFIRLDSGLDLPEQDNLIVRAARLLQQHSRCKQGANIILDKRLPMGGGVGGGSSDAATTLLALNHLWQTGLTLSELAALGLQLGADVPVFVYGRNAWAEGVGEQLTAIDLAPKRFLLLKPDCFISTGDLFSHQMLTRGTAKTTFASYQSQPALFSNDCEPLVQRLFAPVAEALRYLTQHCGNARLTGTGSCVFAEVSPALDFSSVLHQAPCQGWLVNSIAQSPVHAQLGLNNSA